MTDKGENVGRPCREVLLRVPSKETINLNILLNMVHKK